MFGLEIVRPLTNHNRQKSKTEILGDFSTALDVIEQLLELVWQYRDDLKRPPTDSGSIQRRLEAIDAVINPSPKRTMENDDAHEH